MATGVEVSSGGRVLREATVSITHPVAAKKKPAKKKG